MQIKEKQQKDIKVILENSVIDVSIWIAKI